MSCYVMLCYVCMYVCYVCMYVCYVLFFPRGAFSSAEVSVPFWQISSAAAAELVRDVLEKVHRHLSFILLVIGRLLCMYVCYVCM